MLVQQIELTDGYQGLYGEVVTEDCYRLKTLNWQPDVILDIGGNVGVFALYARSLFPQAQIISVEPDAVNCLHFNRFTQGANITLLNKAIGSGQIWHCFGAVNGAHECYLSEGPGYPPDQLSEACHMEAVETDSITVAELIDTYVKPGQRVIVKIDIEGNEQHIFFHAASMKALLGMDYVVMEIHHCAAHGGLVSTVIQQEQTALLSFGTTHNCELQNSQFFYATKYPIDGN